MLGSVVQLPGPDPRSSTLGCVIKVGLEYYAITTMHTFETSHSSCRAPSATDSDNTSTSNSSTAPTVFSGIDVPLHNNKEIFESEVFELLSDDEYDVADVQYDSLSEGEECEPDQADDWSLGTDGSTVHESSDGNRPTETEEMLALFPSSQQLQASGEMDLDWALINVTHLDRCCFNTFSPSGSHSESVSLDKVARSRPQSETPVLIVTSGKVPQRGFLQPGISLLGGISGKTPSSVWTVILDDGSSLKKGDSGSVVVDAVSYDVYGHVVGCNPMGEVYISPYHAILRQVRNLFLEVEVSLPESSTTSLCRPDVATSTDQCTDIPDSVPPVPHDNNPFIVTTGIKYGSHPFKCNSEDQPKHIEHSDVGKTSHESCSVLQADDIQPSKGFHGIKHGVQVIRSECVPTAPNLSSQDASTLSAQFMDYLQNEHVDGMNVEGNAAPYISLSALKRYFTTSHIDTIMRPWEPSPSDIATDIRSSYLRIFSILVYIGNADCIRWFTSNDLQDSDLPFDESSLQHKPSWSDAFLEEQWKFCPIMISADGNFKRSLSSKTILPVTYEKSIAGENQGPNKPRIWQVKVHPGCSYNIEDERVVFKVYQGARAHDVYTTETTTYSDLRLGADSAITKAYTGFSFPESQRCIAILEHTNGGSLIDFFRSKSPPSSSENMGLFWEKMMKLAETVAIFHAVDVPDELTKHSWSRAQLDIRPESILVFSKDENSSISDINFRFEGHSLFKLDGLQIPDQEIATKGNGSRMYLPPECSSGLPTMHSTKADIWSLGAIFSDILIWSISGEAGRERYFDRRMIDLIDHNPCYHDGVKRLRVVDEFHELALLHKKDDDIITTFMNKTILSKMLVPAGERCTAMQIMESFQAEIKQLRLSLTSIPTIPQTGSPEPVAADPSLARISPEACCTNSTAPPLSDSLELPLPGQSPVFSEQRSSSVADTDLLNGESSIEILYRDLKEKNRGSKLGNFNEFKLTKLAYILTVPRMHKAHENLKTGDNIFVIDNSSSMENHKAEVMKTARVLSYMCKEEAYESGMQLFFTSMPTRGPRKFKTSSQIERAIRKANSADEPCNMGNCLDYVLKNLYDNGKRKPTSIYIFTDGLWDEDDLDSSAYEVVRLSIQFIQFGHDLEGTKNLQEIESASSDLASVRHFTDPVPYILSGGIPITKISPVEEGAIDLLTLDLGL
ncbi:hypothetical protein FGADI_4301 [Fusarium gaditjirri]|uniref:Protein kinase domain-containing protein n=1 Tax=Fusarium gaditjirri TaxID=282569 RepID=A0A8H4WZI7_9HYPO|nr:hypothetical protein FGADI_4301 [Fusarium gaditjirri]